ncbi:hypothetical protein R80B4_00135 [Fibrobacteres bacterium R8-0-B4]
MRIVDGIAYADDPIPIAEVVEVRPMSDYRLWLRFTTGEEKVFDVKPKLGFPVFEALKDKELFDGVYVDFGTAVWNGGEIDIAPERLYRDGVS